MCFAIRPEIPRPRRWIGRSPHSPSGGWPGWSSAPPDRLRKRAAPTVRLRVCGPAVRTLRRYLGEGGLESDGNQVRLGAGAVELDTDRLDALVAGQDYEAAAALVSGEFLEGFGVRGASGLDDWIAAERAFWRARSVDALIQRVEQLLRAGSVAPARAVAQRALGLARDSDRAVQAGLP